MMDAVTRMNSARTVFAAIGLAGLHTLAAAQEGPGAWLDRMAGAVSSTSYHGTVIRNKRGQSEALKVVHKIVDGVVNERVTSQEGHGLEIIRIGDEVHCILPNQKSVLVEGWNNQSTLFSPLPRTEVVNTPQYDLSLLSEGRIAGRDAVLLAIRPHDEYRYAHKIWLDTASGFPLQTEIRNIDGELIEEVKFAEIVFTDNIADDAFAASVDLDGFTWYREANRYDAVAIETDWSCDDLPAGFRAISTTTETSSLDGSETTHIVFSDGIANVSVFIEPPNGDEREGWAMLGASNSFSAMVGDFQVTAVGEVPGVTVQRIASSMRRR
jgi:sigma-E factor negative regulatory protein RseB